MLLNSLSKPGASDCGQQSRPGLRVCCCSRYRRDKRKPALWEIDRLVPRLRCDVRCRILRTFDSLLWPEAHDVLEIHLPRAASINSSHCVRVVLFAAAEAFHAHQQISSDCLRGGKGHLAFSARISCLFFGFSCFILRCLQPRRPT